MTLQNAFGNLALDGTLTDGTQRTKVVDSSGNVVGTTSNALDVNIKSGASSGTEYTEDAAAPSNPAGPITQLRRKDALSGAEVSTDGDIITANATSKGELYVKHTDTIAVTQSGAWSLTANQSINTAQINGVTPLMGNGVTGTGSLRVTVASDNTAFSVNSTLSAETTKVIGVTRGADGSGNLLTSTTNALDVNLKTSGLSNLSTNIAQMNGVTVTMGNGASGTGVQRVTIASDSTGVIAVTESGTWTVQPGNTANTTPWLTTQSPATSGGLTTYHLASAGSTNATVVKASAGQLYGWYIYNSNAAARKVAFHNASSTPTAGASIFFTLMIPPTSGANVFTDSGIPFSTGISITTVTDLADSGTTAVAANDLIINLFYK